MAVGVELNPQEKYQIMQNRLGTLSSLFHMAIGFKYGINAKFGVDQVSDIDDPAVRAYHGIHDMRPVVEIVKDVNAIWGEFAEQVLEVTNEFKAKQQEAV